MNDPIMPFEFVGLLVCLAGIVGLGLIQVYKALTLPNAWELMRENNEWWREMFEYDPHERGGRR